MFISDSIFVKNNILFIYYLKNVLFIIILIMKIIISFALKKLFK